MSNIRERSEIEKVKCKVDTLDNFMKSKEFNIDFIKCDVEGAELMVFKGGLETIRKHQPIVFTEMLRKWSAKFSYHPDDIIKLFSEMGYGCYGYVENKIEKIEKVSNEMETTNFFFFHDVKHNSIIKKLGQIAI